MGRGRGRGYNKNNHYNNGGQPQWQGNYGYGASGFQSSYDGNGYGGYPQGGFQTDNYGGNQEWYANDSYGNDFYQGNFNMPYPQQPHFQRGKRGYGFGRGASRGGPNKRGGPHGPKQTVPFKKTKDPYQASNPTVQPWNNTKARKNQQNVAPPVEAGEKKKKNKNGKKHHSKRRQAIYKEKLSLKKKYTSCKQNKNLNAESQLVLTFLKQICHDTCEALNKIVHFVLFSKVLSGHRNALKIFTFEARNLLSERFDLNNEEEKEKLKTFLETLKTNFIDGYKTVFQKDSVTTENIETMEKLVDTYIEKLSGTTFAEENIPVAEDYLFSDLMNHSRRDEDFIVEFKYRFMHNAFECFFFKPHEPKLPTKDNKKRLGFYLENPILPFLIVESVRAKTILQTVPSPVDSYLFVVQGVFRQKTEAYFNDSLALLEKKGEKPHSTPIAKYLNESLDTDVVRDFADCIILFDRMVTYIKFRVMNYTPHILLPVETKEKVFDELVDRMYREALSILVNKETLATQVFGPMEGDPVPENGTQEIKVENIKIEIDAPQEVNGVSNNTASVEVKSDPL